MAAQPHAAKLAAYSSAQAHGGVAAADPHRLIVMLMDGALERISTARGCITRNDMTEKARLLKAMADTRVEMLDEVCKLLRDIRAAWVAIPAEARAK